MAMWHGSHMRAHGSDIVPCIWAQVHWLLLGNGRVPNLLEAADEYREYRENYDHALRLARSLVETTADAPTTQ